MFLGSITRKVVSDSDISIAAKQLKSQISKFEPDCVIYLKDGGKTLGQHIAREIGIPAIGLDIAYPMSRTLNSSSSLIRTLAWPVKELIYKFRLPRLKPLPNELAGQQRIVLVDDSASSGRTVKVALNALRLKGIHRREIIVVVYRCGTKARPLVDHFATTESVLFHRG